MRIKNVLPQTVARCGLSGPEIIGNEEQKKDVRRDIGCLSVVKEDDEMPAEERCPKH